MQYYHPFFWLLLLHCKLKRFTFTNIIYRRSPIVNNIGSEKCRTRTCEIAVLEAAAVATEPTSRKELGYHHSVASLSHSSSVRVPWQVLLFISKFSINILLNSLLRVEESNFPDIKLMGLVSHNQCSNSRRSYRELNSDLLIDSQADYHYPIQPKLWI